MPESSKVMRRIRSFVRREGRITAAQKQALDALWPKFGIQNEGLIDFRKLFARDCPVILEIGFGNGSSLVTMAQANPGNCYLGAEVHRPGVGSLLLNLERQELNNVRISKEDSVNLLQNQIADNSLSAVQIYFPDPWPKARHHKRRLIQMPFMQMIRRKLKPGGTIHLATDWQNYAEHMLEVMEAAEGFSNAHGAGKWMPRPDWRPQTRFELRGLRLGHCVYDLFYKNL